jgi:hypothetical protein
VTFRDNIVNNNGRGGIAAAPLALAAVSIGFNMNDGGYSEGVLPGATDLAADPHFASPAGADGRLGGAGFADDDFHLRPGSPAIDAGSATALELGISGSAVAGATDDVGIVDLGFHYGATSGEPAGASGR